MNNYNKYLSRTREIGKKQIFKRSIGASLLFCIIFGFYGYAFFFGGYLRYNDIKNGDEEYTGGSVLAILFCVIFGAFNLGGAGPHFASVAEGQIGGHLAFEVIEHQPTIEPDDKKAEKLTHKSVVGTYEFKNVNFRYPSKPELHVMNNLNLTIEGGKTTALVGPSGSGKSTIIQLIERFYDPESGRILLDGKDIKSINLNSMRSIIGYVGQEPVLFNTTIRENLKFARPDATED